MTLCTLQTQESSVPCEISADAPLLDEILRAGWEVPYSCRSGVCESCRATIVSGSTLPPPASDGTVLLCKARATSDITVRPVRLGRAVRESTKRFKARVYRVRQADEDVAIVDLRFPAGTKVRFKPGQYLHLHLEGHANPRCFSMANAPSASDSAQLHVRLLPGSVFGAQVLPSLKTGDQLEIELPLGDFYLREGAGPVTLVAGGTGFAPIQSILDAHLGAQKDRAFTLYWGARKAAGLYALDKIEKWQRQHPNFRFVGVVSDEPVEAPWRRGLVHEAVLADHADLRDHQVLVCGTPGLVVAARQSFVHGRGLQPANFYSDGFAHSEA